MIMDLMLLTREDLPIYADRCVVLPIHPSLPGAKLDQHLAYEVFPQAYMTWYEELKEYAKEHPEYDDMARRKPKINKRGDTTHWYPSVYAPEGFAVSLNINPMGCVCISYQSQDPYRHVSPLDGDRFLKMSKEKKLFYAADIYKSPDGDAAIINSYVPHNIDSYVQALMMRSWAVEYLNAALRSTLVK